MSIFNSVPITKLSRSTFNLDHENKLSFNFGGLYPVLTQTILPGDRMSLGVQSFLRTVPLLSPVMHRNDIKLDSFFVPFRLIWDNYEKFLQCQDATIKFPKLKFKLKTLPIVRYNEIMGVGSLADYLGFASVPATAFPTADGNIVGSYASDRTMDVLPFRAYQLIYDYYFRNKALEESILDPNSTVGLAGYDIKSNSDVAIEPDADDPIYDLFTLKYRSWRRDMFTSALPSPQKGSGVLLPESSLAVEKDGNFKLTPSPQAGEFPLAVDTSGDVVSLDSGEAEWISEKYKSGLKVTKSNQPTIEDFRYAEVLEEYEEALARSAAGEVGSFKEWLLSIWRTLSPDARLDRPEYLGGYRGPIQISEVPQTSSATESSPQGSLAGKGLSVGGQLLFKKHNFKEPGILMVIASVVPKSAYFQGDPRQFLYDNCYDFPNPYFANLGEQEIKPMEICASHAMYNSQFKRTWGYQVRNYEMKSIPDGIHGALRDSLMYWHEGRYFNDFVHGALDPLAPPRLNKNFIKMYPPEVSRIFPSSESSDKLILECYFNFRAKRSLPYYGVPRVGHTK